LRHSIGRPQAWQIFGAKPFLVRACLEAGWRSGTAESRTSREGSHPRVDRMTAERVAFIADESAG